MKDRASLFLLLCTLIWVALPGAVSADNGPAIGDLACDPANDLLEPTRYLRSLSLDLRGTVPTEDEVNQVRVLETVPDELIDSWLDTDEFAEQVVRHHRKLIWNNVTNVNIVNVSFRLRALEPEFIGVETQLTTTAERWFPVGRACRVRSR